MFKDLNVIILNGWWVFAKFGKHQPEQTASRNHITTCKGMEEQHALGLILTNVVVQVITAVMLMNCRLLPWPNVSHICCKPMLCRVWNTPRPITTILFPISLQALNTALYVLHQTMCQIFSVCYMCLLYTKANDQNICIIGFMQ